MAQVPASAAHPDLSGGYGTFEEPFLISSPEDLIALSDYANNEAGWYEDYFYALTNDIDMSGIDFEPINNMKSDNSFYSCNFDGRNFTIKNLTIAKNNNFCGLFGHIDGEHLIVKDLHIENLNIDIETSEPFVFAGGIIANYSGTANTIQNCSVKGKINFSTYVDACIGGIAGCCTGIDIINCKNYANINVEYGFSDVEETGIGGIVGYIVNDDIFHSKVLNKCSNYGNVKGPSKVGGIAGYADGTTVSNNNNCGHITFYDDYAGGIIGKAKTSAIDFCCNIGAVTISFEGVDNKSYLTSKYIGGICGYNKVMRTVYSTYHVADNLNAGYIAGWDYTGGVCGYPFAFTYNNVNIAPVFDGKPYLTKCKSSSNLATYPFDEDGFSKNTPYGGALYDKQMSLLKDSMNNKVFDGIAKLAELYTSQMLYDSIYHHFTTTNEMGFPHRGKYDWIYNENQYAVPNEIDKDFNVLASLVLKLDTSDRANDVNHKFTINFIPTEEQPLIVSASNNKICKVGGNTIGLVGTGFDTLRIYYKGIMREIPLKINSVDTLMFSGGAGSEDNPYLLSCLKDLKELEYVTNKFANTKYPEKNWSYDKYFKVTEHIDSSFTGLIGKVGEKNEFQGHFDGNGKRITIAIEKGQEYAALFAVAGKPCTIINLEVNGTIQKCKNGAGIVCLGNEITIDSCLNTTNISVSDTAGGLIAIANKCSISNCGNNGLVRSNKLSGGIAGYIKEGVLAEIVNGGTVISAKTAGGLAGSTPGTLISTGVNYGYTGRTVNEIDGTMIGYTIGDLQDGEEENTYWNAQTNTIWDATWETEGLSTKQMLTDEAFKDNLGIFWHTTSENTLAIPNALKKFEGTVLLNIPYSFAEEWNTLKDLNDTLKLPGEQFLISETQTNLSLINTNNKVTPKLKGAVIPTNFGSDTLNIIYYYSGLENQNNYYRKIVPLFISKGFASGGKGTEKDPYIIKSDKDFAQMVSAVNEDYYSVDTLRNASWHKYFKQTAPITSIIAEPIGNNTKQRYNWNGHYDGGGNTLNVAIKGNSYCGLFSTLSKGASVKNLQINGTIEGADYCGSLAGQLSEGCVIDACKNNASVNGSNYVGGIAGLCTKGSITNSINTNSIKGNKNIGGICGRICKESHTNDLLNLGQIKGSQNVGGIVGIADSSDLRRAVNVGITSGANNVGGIAGLYRWNGVSNMIIYQCMNYGYIDKDAEYVGAIVGNNENKTGTNVTLCFYNNQLTLTKAINGVDNEGFSSGLSTKEFLGDQLYLKLDDNWSFNANHYPMPTTLSGLEASVASSPALILENETYINLGTEFEVVNDADVTWSSKHGKLAVEDNMVSFNRSGIDTLIAEIEGIRKEQPVFITNGLFSGGNGSQKRPYRLTTKTDLEDLALYVNTNMLEVTNSKNWSDGLYFSLENDIPEDSVISTTIGKPDTESEKQYIHFGGIFNGHGHKINVNIEGEEDNVGLFGYLNKGSIDSLTIYGTISGTSNVGGFAGYCEYGTISNSQNSAKITGNNDVGGICGYLSDGSITNCGNAGAITSSENKAGGIVAETNGSSINSCVNIASVSAYTVNSYTGGICGKINGGCTLNSCINAGIITGENRIGGIAGECSNSKISESIVVNDINYVGYSTTANKGFVCGVASGSTTISSCYYDNQMTTLKNATDENKVSGLLTKDLLGDNLSETLNTTGWIFEANKYPRPSNDTISLLASSAFVLQENAHSQNIDDDFNAYTFDECSWKTLVPTVVVTNNVAKLQKMGKDYMVVSHNDLEKKVAINIQCITKHNHDTIVGCDSVLFEGKHYYSNISFNDTLKSLETGCDSLVGICIIVNHSSVAPEQPIIYTSKDTLYKGILCTKDTTLIFHEENAAGCDSVVTQVINIAKARIENIDIKAGCDSTNYDNKWFYKDTLLTIGFKDEQGRDTLIQHISIPVNKSLVETTNTIKAYDSLFINNIYIYKDTLLIDSTLLETGCDHIIKTPVTIGKTNRRYSNKTYCASQSNVLYLHDNSKIAITGDTIVNDTVQKTDKLLDITIYTIDVRQPKDTTITITNCDFISFRGNTYRESIQLDSVYATEWCDSTVHYVLNVIKPTRKVQMVENCYITKYKGVEYTESTILYDTLPGASYQGCDSIIETRIVVNEATSDTLHTYGLEEKEVYGVNVTNDTTFVDTLQNAAGCDSFVVTQVHITHFTRDTTTLYGCDSLNYYGIWYKSNASLIAGTYEPNNAWDDLDKKSQKFLSKEDIVMINIGKQQEFVENIDSCEQITFRGKIYTENAEIRDTFHTISGCDSIIIYRLRLHQPKEEGEVNISGCGQATWRGISYTQDTTFVENLTTKWGCDSICNVRIIIREPDEKSIIERGCEIVEYEGETFDHDTTLTRVYTNQGGCDSTVYIHIKVYKPSYSTVTYEGEYDVYYNGRKYTRSTVLRDTLTNKHGCDSIVTIAIIVTKGLDYPLIVNKYNYMLLCNNNIGNDKYTSYQWYKNGKPLSGQTKPYFNEAENEQLEGCYQVYVKTTTGNEYFSEEICIEKEKELVLYPNPVAEGQPVTIEYEFTEKQKKGLYFDVYNSAGLKVYSGTPTQYPIEIPGQKKKGYYFILITTGEDKNLGSKFIVK